MSEAPLPYGHGIFRYRAKGAERNPSEAYPTSPRLRRVPSSLSSTGLRPWLSAKEGKNIKTVLDILADEVRGDVKSAIAKLTKDYSMTWVYIKKNGKLFPRTGKNIQKELKQVYPIKGREYNIKNIAESKNLVVVEMVESYPDPKTKKIYRTPQIIVLEMRNGKIHKGRHYCDPNLSYLHLTEKQIKKIYK